MKSYRKLATGDYIAARDEEDFKDLLDCLSKAGYGAVRTSPNLFEVCITSIPAENEAKR